MKSFTLVYQGERSERLDRVVCQAVTGSLLTRSQAQHLIRGGHVLINGTAATKPGDVVKPGYTVSVEMALRESSEIKPEKMDLEILFEDSHLIVLNKPSGLSVHPGAGMQQGTLVNGLLAHVGSQIQEVGDAARPGIVHRLDKDTTGVLVVAKSVEVHASLAKQFERRTIDRSYTALVLLTPRSTRALRTEDEGRIETLIGRHPVDRKRMAVLESDGRNAITNWKVTERFMYGAEVKIKLGTGRTHQIRVHMDHVGSPVIGDQVYGNFSVLPPELKFAAEKFGRQALHAETLAFTHPKTCTRESFSAPIPEDFKELMQIFRGYKG